MIEAIHTFFLKESLRLEHIVGWHRRQIQKDSDNSKNVK